MQRHDGLSLEALGWDEARASAFARVAGKGLVPGRVALESTHVYRVLTAEGERLAHVAGRFRHRAASRRDFPAVGDWVALRQDANAARAVIEAILPRTSRFSRKVAGAETEEQVVAANIDVIFLVSGLDEELNLRRIERYLVVARESGAAPVILLNKADLDPDHADRAREVATAAGDVPVLSISSRTGDGFDALDAYLQPGRTVALLGSSGVGKSSIVNRLVGRELLATRDVRARDSRGRHASTVRQLVILPTGAIVIDTPGLRELQLWDASANMPAAFDDIEAIAAACRFRDCRHDQEPGCAVKEAVEEGRLPAERLANYHKLAGELRRLEERQRERERERGRGR
jgi:ribosome biogenesis GTPase